MQGDVITLFVHRQHNFCHRWLTMMPMRVTTILKGTMTKKIMIMVMTTKSNDDEGYFNEGEYDDNVGDGDEVEEEGNVEVERHQISYSALTRVCDVFASKGTLLASCA